MNGSTIHSSPPFTISPSSPSHSDKTQVPRVAKTLVISEVGVEHLNVPFQCRATNALGRDVGQILLKTANHEMFYCVVGMAVFCGMLLVCVYLCWRRRVDLVLLYRSLCPALHKQCDGKLYDAYVSYPSGNSVSMAMTFALRVLPEVLERNYGYKLFIRGRDDLPGEAVFDIIDEALAKSRRLIIVLDGTPMETHTLNVHAEIIPLTFTHTHGETHAQSHTHTQSDTHTDTNTLTHTHIDTYTQSDTHTHTNTLTHQEKIPLTFTHTPSKTHTWSDTHKGTQTESVTHSDTHPDTHTQSDTLTDTHTQSDTHTDTHTQSDTLTDTHTQSDTLTDTHTDTHTQSDTHTDTHTQSDTHTDTNTQSDTHTQSNTHTDTQTQTDTHPDTHTHSDTHTDTHTQWDPDTHTQWDPEQVFFERTLGQYDALVSSGLKVLIVQTGEEGSTLPPPLLLLTRSKRPLRWHTHSHTHSHSHSHTPSQQRFWKELRYRMPAPRKTIHQNSHTHTSAV